MFIGIRSGVLNRAEVFKGLKEFFGFFGCFGYIWRGKWVDICYK